jgi:DNA ligase-1
MSFVFTVSNFGDTIEPSVLVALAHACVFSSQEGKKETGEADEKTGEALRKATNLLKQAYTEVPSFDVVVPSLLKYGISSLPSHCFLTPGVPVKVMLGKPCKGIQDVVTHFGKNTKFTLEFKYDGERAQIHVLPDGTVKIYSRNLENNTGKYPDLIPVIKAACGPDTKSCILDCEVVAWDMVEKKILPFQSLSTRKRKNVEEKDVQVQVCLYAFDLIHHNGRSLFKHSLLERRNELHKHFRVTPGQFQWAESLDTSDTKAIETFMKKAVDSSCEGLMVKALDIEAEYVPNKRNWLKLKKDYMAGVGDTLDLVPIGAFYGRGKRTGHYGAYLLACYDEDTEEYQSVCKVLTSFLSCLLVFFFSHHTLACALFLLVFFFPSCSPRLIFFCITDWYRL